MSRYVVSRCIAFFTLPDEYTLSRVDVGPRTVAVVLYLCRGRIEKRLLKNSAFCFLRAGYLKYVCFLLVTCTVTVP